jgi:peptidoglycan/LPS O-acetylase OafA/YrhL
MGPRGDVIGGWSVDPQQLHIGFARLLYPFFAGLLLSRMGKLIRLPGAFGICSLMIAVIFCIPRLGDRSHLWINGLYESFCIILLLPLIISIGAGGSLKGGYPTRICRWLGKISYPVYITHYPLIYTYTAWVSNNKVPLRSGIWMGLLLFASAIGLGYACLKLYDEPVRNWLSRRFPGRKVT